MKKVGTITFHCADNFGAVLQVYSLQEVIKSYGFDFEIIDFKPKRITSNYQLLLDVGDSIKTRGVTRTIKELILRTKNIKKNNIRIKNFKEFRSKHLKLTPKSYRTASQLIKDRPRFDFYITGSDQVWNPDFFVSIGSSYFLDFAAEESIKISYAASIAIHVEDENHIKYFENHIKDFDYVSVREKSSKEFISQFTDKEVLITLDPTLLSARDRWEKISTFSTTKEKYILVYDLVKDPVIIYIANLVARKYGCKIISYSKQKGYDNWLGSFAASNPTEFLGLFEHSEFIITSSFHGTAFAVIYNKPFYTIPHATRGNRMIDLLSDLELNERIITNINDNQIINKEIDYIKVNNILSELRLKSFAFLESALNEIDR